MHNMRFCVHIRRGSEGVESSLSAYPNLLEDLVTFCTVMPLYRGSIPVPGPGFSQEGRQLSDWAPGYEFIKFSQKNCMKSRKNLVAGGCAPGVLSYPLLHTSGVSCLGTHFYSSYGSVPGSGVSQSPKNFLPTGSLGFGSSNGRVISEVSHSHCCRCIVCDISVH